MRVRMLMSCVLAVVSTIALADEAPQRVAGFGPNTLILDQGLDEDTVQKWWFTGQGSEMIPRAWLLALERPNGQRFATAETFDRYRYLPASPTKHNPEGWPLGFSISKDPASGTEWFGYTCAGCHTGRVDYGGKSLIVTGGATMGNLSGLLGDMIDTMLATARDEARFARFATEVLGRGHNNIARDQLRNEVVTLASTLLVRKNGMVDSGYARLDAFGTIFNQILGAVLELPNNQVFADAPVSYPFLWDAPHTDRVQWNGSVSNSGLQGPIGRNVAEIMGVFGRVIIDPSRKMGYSSSIDFNGLGNLEHWLQGLWSPLWPEEVLPALNRAKVARGKVHYAKHCASCHVVLADRTDPERRITAKMVAVGDVGTDPRTANNFAQRIGKTGRLEGQKEYYLFGRALKAEEQGMAFLNNAAVGVMMVHLGDSAEAALQSFSGFYADQHYDPIKNPSYKARPLNGIWATAPYLHNGSVANLWDLMQPPARRSPSFHVGSYNFDPVKVGYETGPSPISSLFTAQGAGNSNAGHTYGTQLSDKEKWDLIEYLKSL